MKQLVHVDLVWWIVQLHTFHLLSQEWGTIACSCAEKPKHLYALTLTVTTDKMVAEIKTGRGFQSCDRPTPLKDAYK